MKDQTVAWIGTIVAIIASWDKIINFINGTLSGIDAFLKSLPPIILLGLIILVFWGLAKKP